MYFWHIPFSSLHSLSLHSVLSGIKKCKHGFSEKGWKFKVSSRFQDDTRRQRYYSRPSYNPNIEYINAAAEATLSLIIAYFLSFVTGRKQHNGSNNDVTNYDKNLSINPRPGYRYFMKYQQVIHWFFGMIRWTLRISINIK